MCSPTDPTLQAVLGQQRKEAALRRESLGPLVEATAMLRATTAAVRCLLDELETQVGVHLELLNIIMQTQYGNQWWEQLREGHEVEGGLR
jgi:hypothetical protein